MVVIVRVRSLWAARLLKRAGSLHITMRSFGIVTAGLALSAMGTTDIAPAMPPAPRDPRIERLERFFTHYNCPAPYHISDYLRAADDYDLDYRLLPAISVRETTCGLTEQQNNRWGYHPGRQAFESIEEGIEYVARTLAEGDFYRGKSLREKLFTYNPRPAYPVEVQKIMRQIE